MGTQGYIQGYDCDITNLDQNGNYLPSNNYYVTPMERRTACLEIYKGPDTNRILISVVKFLVIGLPDPELYIGTASSSHNASRDETKMFVKHGTDQFIDDFDFDIVNWELKIHGRRFKGKGNTISAECSIYLKRMIRKGTGEMTVLTMGPDKTERVITGEYHFSSRKEYRHPYVSDIPLTDEYGEPIITD